MYATEDRSLSHLKHRQEKERVMVQEGLELVQRRKEERIRQKQMDQSEVRRLIANYDPWGKPGGGAPNAEDVRRRKTSIHYYHLLDQKQFLPEIRRSIQRCYRFSQSPYDKHRYRLELDSLVGYRNHLLSEAMRKSTSFDQKLGWTGEPAFRRLEQEHQRREQQYKTRPSTNYQAIPPPPDMERRKEIHAPEELITGGVELVPLLARRRALPQHCPLSTTDVTNTRLRTPVMPPPARSPTWNKPEMEKEYLSELTNQVHYKQKKIRDAHTEDLANSRRHFETWCNFWGRPGHGAPKQSNVKENLNYLLYDAPVK
ncbi:uncharacterized protein LOC111060167 isoform X2 [Nilaparvata lugens]|uniref:uncharacterized protein LOC111060167 isoform X2 n=1 Tax=Nilaparvata lugens TaxID=108931 RepID=UPI00193C8E47|nr:uncharacterized protein LOC111060167 isoform X2 [Nilaparvata lugens]